MDTEDQGSNGDNQNTSLVITIQNLQLDPGTVVGYTSKRPVCKGSMGSNGRNRNREGPLD